ncbi:MAG: twin-arginine translocase TatA/TatE family subunit [Candidatus Binatia bacterium]
MFGLGFPELAVILVVALVIFGPSKLPELGNGLGKGLRDFRKAFESPEEIEGDPKKPDEEKPREDA